MTDPARRKLTAAKAAVIRTAGTNPRDQKAIAERMTARPVKA
jgi:hypothetical protein